MRIKAFILSAFFLSLPVQAEIIVEGAYIPQLPPSANAHAAYLSISNTGKETRMLVGIEAVGFKMSHLHESVVTDGVSSMKSIHRLEIKPGEKIVMEPGSLHIMLMKPDETALAKGEVSLDLKFKNGEIVRATAELRVLN